MEVNAPQPQDPEVSVVSTLCESHLAIHAMNSKLEGGNVKTKACVQAHLVVQLLHASGKLYHAPEECPAGLDDTNTHAGAGQ